MTLLFQEWDGSIDSSKQLIMHCLNSKSHKTIRSSTRSTPPTRAPYPRPHRHRDSEHNQHPHGPSSPGAAPQEMLDIQLGSAKQSVEGELQELFDELHRVRKEKQTLTKTLLAAGATDIDLEKPAKWDQDVERQYRTSKRQCASTLRAVRTRVSV